MVGAIFADGDVDVDAAGDADGDGGLGEAGHAELVHAAAPGILPAVAGDDVRRAATLRGARESGLVERDSEAKEKSNCSKRRPPPLRGRRLEEDGRREMANVGACGVVWVPRDGVSGRRVLGEDATFGLQQAASGETARALQEWDGALDGLDLAASGVPGIDRVDGGAVPRMSMRLLVLVPL